MLWRKRDDITGKSVCGKYEMHLVCLAACMITTMGMVMALREKPKGVEFVYPVVGSQLI